jgi:hypothetical protein
MKVLYFDLDGTLVGLESGVLKPQLAGGAFERAARAGGFERLVCVSSAVSLIPAVRARDPETDGHALIWRLCEDAFEDEAWFRRAVAWVEEPERRARHLDLGADWWYLDDRAELYLAREGLDGLLHTAHAVRILAPDPNGDGSDVLEWLGRETRRAEVDAGSP